MANDFKLTNHSVPCGTANRVTHSCHWTAAGCASFHCHSALNWPIKAADYTRWLRLLQLECIQDAEPSAVVHLESYGMCATSLSHRSSGWCVRQGRPCVTVDISIKRRRRGCFKIPVHMGRCSNSALQPRHTTQLQVSLYSLALCCGFLILYIALVPWVEIGCWYFKTETILPAALRRREWLSLK